ncbi:hypothetical protein K435DRAFT_857932 [Dendrothele bispora CBS 962.96]|uniref:C2H2-type domain-containing protein n=1 Tax=Dendrothele bispora (strain CBS 962.96) TaxID=1314807 RepID=A0A4S8M504_DENBC|nr:hypothetical protein K435DRAFT_857932 [Dendrothele bispora CBS 962.96]
MSTPLGDDQDYEAFMYAILTHGDDFGIDPSLSRPSSWNGKGSVCATALSHKRAKLTGHLPRLQMVDDPTRTMSASACGNIVMQLRDELSGISSAPSTIGFSPTTPASGASPTTPYSSNTPFFADSHTALFIKNGDERGSSGDVNQHHQTCHSTNGNEYTHLPSSLFILPALPDSPHKLPGTSLPLIVCLYLDFPHIHIWSHLGVKPFHCPEPGCRVSSTVPRTLKRHVSTVHKKPSESVKWPQADFSDYPEWPWLNSDLSTLNDMAVEVRLQTSNNGA